MLCQYCNKDFNETIRSHIKKHNLTIKQYYDLFYKKENDGKCLTCGKETCFITFKIGYRKYCSNLCAGNNKETILLRKKTKLKKYGDENFNNHKKAEQTCITKYGVNNVSKLNEIKIKKEETTKLHYGVKNPYQIKEVKEKCLKNNLLKGKSYITNETIKKYNKIYSGKVLSIKNNIIKFICNICNKTIIMDKTLFCHRLYDHRNPCIECNKKFNCYSNKEKELVKIIKKFYNGELFENYRKFENITELDIFIPDLNIAFEFNGTYWHADPRVYKEDDIIGIKKEYAKDLWKKDQIKLNECIKNNIKLYTIWEIDFDNGIEDYIKEIFSELEVK